LLLFENKQKDLKKLGKKKELHFSSFKYSFIGLKIKLQKYFFARIFMETLILK
jgi:hypothetical protein